MIWKKYYRSACLVIIVALAIFLTCFKIQVPTVERWDEQTNLNVVDASAQTLPILTLDGEPFYEKPPFWYYLAIVITRILSTDVWALRLISAGSALVIFVLVYELLRTKINRKAGIISVFTLFAIPQLFLTNHGNVFATHTLRSADLDALQLAFIMMAWLAMTKIVRNHNYLYVFSIALAVAFMIKGPLVFFFCIFATYFLWKEEILQKLPRDQILKALIASLIIVLPWHLLMWIRFGGEFWQNYVYYHIFQRTISPIEGHEHQLSFYLKLLLDMRINPIGWYLIAANFYEIFGRKVNSVVFVSALTSIAYLILITLVQTKLAWYLLPFYILSSIGAGAFGVRLLEKPKSFMKLALVIALFCIICFSILQILLKIATL